MGYKTYHYLELDPPLSPYDFVAGLLGDNFPDNIDANDEDELIDLFTSMHSGMGYCLEIIDPQGRCCSAEKGKWYDEKEDLLRLSNAYPHVHITLWVGEDLERPQYVGYFLGGKSEYVEPEIVIPPSTLR